MFGLRTVHSQLSTILQPLSYQLNACWWYLGGAGATLESSDYDEYEQLTDQQANYLVGKPGWFRRFIDNVDTNWAVYLACESSSAGMPLESLDHINSFLSSGVDWMGDAGKWPLPSDVVLVCRDVDDAYWDLFFREENLAKVTQDHLRRFPDIVSSALTSPEEK